MVDLIGIEPMTSSMPWKRAPSCATGPRAEGCNSPIVSGGAGFVKPGGAWGAKSSVRWILGTLGEWNALEVMGGKKLALRHAADGQWTCLEKENDRDREHFRWVPVSKRMEGAGHSVESRCSISRALGAASDSGGSFLAVGSSGRSKRIWAIGILLIAQSG